MNNHERRQQRIILGWSLEVAPGSLAGYPVQRGIDELQGQLFELLSAGKFDGLAPEGSTDAEVKKRLQRVERALAGVSFQMIAEEEGVAANSVRESIKDTLRRLKVIGIE